MTNHYIWLQVMSALAIFAFLRRTRIKATPGHSSSLLLDKSDSTQLMLSIYHLMFPMFSHRAWSGYELQPCHCWVPKFLCHRTLWKYCEVFLTRPNLFRCSQLHSCADTKSVVENYGQSLLSIRKLTSQTSSSLFFGACSMGDPYPPHLYAVTCRRRMQSLHLSVFDMSLVEGCYMSLKYLAMGEATLI